MKLQKKYGKKGNVFTVNRLDSYDNSISVSGPTPSKKSYVMEGILNRIETMKRNQDDKGDNPFQFRVAKPRNHIKSNYDSETKTTDEISKSIIEKREFMLDNDMSSLEKESEILKKRFNKFKNMNKDLISENNDLKTKISERELRRRRMKSEMDMINKKMKYVEDGSKFKDRNRMKLEARLNRIEGTLMKAKVMDSGSLISNIVNMNKKHRQKRLDNYNEIEKHKQDNESFRERTKSINVVDSSSLIPRPI